MEASGNAVGLPAGFVGNSEVGHITIGAGRRIEQSLLRINNSIKDGTFFRNDAVLHLIQNVKKKKTRLHLIGILQKEGIHGYLPHFEALLKYAKKEGLSNDDVILHIFTDGRDAYPKNAINYLAELAEIISKQKVGIVATIAGRYFGMDRNNNLDRTKKSFQAIFEAQGENFDCGLEKLEEKYQQGITDEFIEPLVKNGYGGVKNDDSVFFVNFRKDRARQLTKMILENENKYRLKFASMTRYYKEQNSEIAFDDLIPRNTLGDILEKTGKSQLRISETEKFAHVTFFFDGGVAKKQKNRDDIIIPSPRVTTYDLKPEMSSKRLTEITLTEIRKEKYGFILLNFPNADMVGHTGNIESTEKAIEAIDKSCQLITEEALKENYIVILTADHGNAEEMIGKNITSHSKNLVPTTIISKEKLTIKKNKLFSKERFSLQNIAPTVLALMGIKKPEEMSESMVK